MKKKIAILYSGARAWGGVETYLKDLIKDAGGIEFYFYSMGGWELAGFVKDKAKVTVLSRKRASLLLPFTLGSSLNREGASVLVSQGVVANFYARLTCLLFKKKHICIVHSDLATEYRNPILKNFYLATDKILRKETDLFICVSKHLKSVLVGRGVDSKKIRVIYNGINIRPKAKDQKPKTDKIIIGSMGRLSREKGCDTLIEAAKLLSGDIEIEIYGEGDERESLTRLIEANDLTGRVRLLGFIKEKEKAFENFDIYIQPSRSEGFGLAVLEAMGRGIPVIVSSSGALPEIAGEGASLVLKDISPEEITKNINLMIGDYQKFKAEASSKKTRIIDKYSYSKWLEETEKTIGGFAKSSGEE